MLGVRPYAFTLRRVVEARYARLTRVDGNGAERSAGRVVAGDSAEASSATGRAATTATAASEATAHHRDRRQRSDSPLEARGDYRHDSLNDCMNAT